MHPCISKPSAATGPALRSFSEGGGPPGSRPASDPLQFGKLSAQSTVLSPEPQRPLCPLGVLRALCVTPGPVLDSTRHSFLVPRDSQSCPKHTAHSQYFRSKTPDLFSRKRTSTMGNIFEVRLGSEKHTPSVLRSQYFHSKKAAKHTISPRKHNKGGRGGSQKNTL